MSDDRNPFAVQVGQIWESCDPRAATRKLQVLEVDLEWGRAKVCSPYGPRPIRRIALKRFRPDSSGYRLLSGPSTRGRRSGLAEPEGTVVLPQLRERLFELAERSSLPV